MTREEIVKQKAQEFASKVKDTHGDNKFANQYLKVIDFVNKYFEKDEQH